MKKVFSATLMLGIGLSGMALAESTATQSVVSKQAAVVWLCFYQSDLYPDSGPYGYLETGYCPLRKYDPYLGELFFLRKEPAP